MPPPRIHAERHIQRLGALLTQLREAAGKPSLWLAAGMLYRGDDARRMAGVVKGMGGHGIRMMGDGTVVERVHATENGGPGIVVGNGSIIDSLASQNASGNAVVGLIVRGTIASHNVFGIYIRPGGVGSGNSAFSNGYAGISTTCPAVLVGNTSTGNGTNYAITGVCATADNAQ